MVGLLCKLFVKNQEDVENPAVRSAYGTMVSLTGIFLNLLLFAGKLTVGWISASVSITADAVNNLSDAGSQIISLVSFRISAKPADREHPFGHARIEYVASMIVSFLILLVGVELFKGSVEKFFSSERSEPSYWVIGVLIGSILVKLWMAYFNSKIGKKIDSSVMRATAADSLSDVLSTGAVLVATVICMIFPNLSFNLDALMGLGVSVLILIAGGKIFLETKDAILGEAPADEIVKEILKTVSKYPEALGVHDLVVHNYGPGHVIAALHIEVDGNADVFLSHDVIDNIESELRREHHIEATIHLDPIVTDDEEINRMKQAVLEIVTQIDEGMRIHDFRFVRGTTHTNLIFDVAVPFEVKMTETEIKEEISDRVSEINPSYFTVVQIDRI